MWRINVHQECNTALAPVKNLQDFHAHVQLAVPGGKAFAKLSPAARAEFILSLRFGARGVASFNYRVLERELGASDAHDVLAMFGLQSYTSKLTGLQIRNERDALAFEASRSALTSLTPATAGRPKGPGVPGGGGWGDDEGGDGEGNFLKGYMCTSRATCSKSSEHACTSNC